MEADANIGTGLLALCGVVVGSGGAIALLGATVLSAITRPETASSASRAPSDSRSRHTLSTESPHDRVDDDLLPAEKEDAWVCLEAVARIVAQG
jgi:hypothetical protein